jgi:hypothetical protein
VTVSPLSEKLAADHSDTVTLTLSIGASLKPQANPDLLGQGCTTCTLTIDPGGIVVTVDIVVGDTGTSGALGPAGLPGRPALGRRLVD